MCLMVTLGRLTVLMTRTRTTGNHRHAWSVMKDPIARHLPIVENDEIVGMVSIGDLVKSRLQDCTVEIKYLREFIST